MAIAQRTILLRHLLVFEKVFRACGAAGMLLVGLIATTAVFEIRVELSAELALAAIAETAFLAHAAQLLARLHRTAFRAELVELAGEGDELADFAVERAILQRHLQRGAQANGIEKLLLAGNHPCLAARELLLELLAEGFVEHGDVLGVEAFAIGRIREHQAARCLTALLRCAIGGSGELKVADVALLHADNVLYAGGTDICQGGAHGIVVEVEAIDMMVKLALFRVVLEDFAEELRLKVLPVLKAELLAEHARIDVAGDEGGLYEEGAAAAEGIDDVAVALPAAHLDDGRCQHLVDGSFYARLAIATQVEALAAGVEREGADVFGNMNVEANLRIADTDVGAFALALHEVVHDGILHLVGDEARVAEGGAIYRRIDGE